VFNIVIVVNKKNGIDQKYIVLEKYRFVMTYNYVFTYKKYFQKSWVDVFWNNERLTLILDHQVLYIVYTI